MKTSFRRESGATLIEVLVTIIILAFGLLGVAGLQARIYVLEFESYQRAQAIVMLNDIAERVIANRGNAVNYITPTWIGTGDSQPASCGALVGTARDTCEWSNLLKGAGERQGASTVGGMEGGRACITAFTAPASTKVFDRCQTGYQIDVVWRGRSATIVPGATCAQNQYGTNDAVRRAVTTRVGTGDTPC